MPGTQIPIVGPPFDKASAGRQGKPDYFVILAWNFAEAIMENNRWFTEQGGKWIIPVPEPRVV